MNPPDELETRLRHAAREVARNAHAPYSHFPVGAAVVAEDGRVYAACNVENASFSLTQCAERVALAMAIADGCRPGTLQRLVIYTPGERPHPPCGACRQFMAELMAPTSRVLCCCDSEETLSWADSSYLPCAFTPGMLEQSGGGGS